MPPRNTPSSRRAVLLTVAGVVTAVVAGMPWGAADARVGAAVRRVQRGVARAARQSEDSNNREVRVHNQTGWTMTHLYASSGGDWGGDLLGSAVLGPGDSMVVTIDDGSGACRYALRAEFDNGQALERAGINACQVADYYFTR